jgi:hypothetical protein
MKKTGYYVLLLLGIGVVGYFTTQGVLSVMSGAKDKREALQSIGCSATNAGTLRYSNGCFQYCDGKGVWINKNAGCGYNSHTASCTGLPEGAEWNTASGVTQTWNGSEWIPTTIGSYSIIGSTTECRFKCKTNYTRNSSTCQVSYKITATAGAGGSISSPGETSVVSGVSKTYTLTPSTNWHILSVKIDGVALNGTALSTVISTKQYTFINVTANHTIEVTFASNPGYALRYGASVSDCYIEVDSNRANSNQAGSAYSTVFYPSEPMPFTKNVHIHNPGYMGDAVYLIIYHSPSLGGNSGADITVKAVHKFTSS